MRLGVDGPTVKEGRFAVGHSLSLLVVRLLSNLRRELKPDSLDEDNLLTCARSSPALLRLEAESEQHSTWTGVNLSRRQECLRRCLEVKVTASSRLRNLYFAGRIKQTDKKDYCGRPEDNQTNERNHKLLPRLLANALWFRKRRDRQLPSPNGSRKRFALTPPLRMQLVNERDYITGLERNP